MGISSITSPGLFAGYHRAPSDYDMSLSMTARSGVSGDRSLSMTARSGVSGDRFLLMTTRSRMTGDSTEDSTEDRTEVGDHTTRRGRRWPLRMQFTRRGNSCTSSQCHRSSTGFFELRRKHEQLALSTPFLFICNFCAHL